MEHNNETVEAIREIESREKLEAIGKTLSISQLMDFLGIALAHDKQIWKLSPLLVGLPHAAFKEMLLRASVEELHLLQNEGVTEPLQHHLTLLGHELQTQIEQTLLEIELFKRNLNAIDLQAFGLNQVESLYPMLDGYSLTFKQLLNLTIKSLGIVWNTQRVDLIDTFSKAKTLCNKVLSQEIGSSRGAHSQPNGLYAGIEDKLFAIYGNPQDPSQIDASRDDEPVIEALVKFSMWYLRDYWELGLLPMISKKEELEMDKDEHSETERSLYRQKLFTQAQQSLEKMGLSTVRDLKNAHIFSKKTLQEYIRRHKH